MSFVSILKSVEFLSKYNLFETGYNIYNTLLFSIIGIFIYFFVVWSYLVWRKIKIDFDFVKSVLIFVGIGVILRLFSQEGISIFNIIEFKSNPLSLGFYFHFPQLFILISLLFLLFFEISIFLSKNSKYSYNQILQAIGLLIFFPLLFYVFINITNWLFFIFVIFLSLLVVFITIKLFSIFKSSIFKNKINVLVIISQILDGIATFSAVYFLRDNFIEQHVFSSFILSINPVFFVLFKLVFSIFLIWVIDYFVTDIQNNIYFKLFIIIIGFVTGFKSILLVCLAI
jgi:uncharacterized membrane protein